MYKHEKNIQYSGLPLKKAKKAMILIHGRGANPEDILSLTNHLNVDDFALLAPEAKYNTWYPESFLAPREDNEPALSSALTLIGELNNEIKQEGIRTENIFLLGFSQGACLSLEFAARNPEKYGGIVAFTGGLIGDKVEREQFIGDFAATTIFIGSGDNDPHVPIERIKLTTEIFTTMNANVIEKIYHDLPHTISLEEIKIVNDLFFAKENAYKSEKR